MHTHTSRWGIAGACGLTLLLANAGMAQQAAPAPRSSDSQAVNNQPGQAHVIAERAFRSSKITGMEVKNVQGQSLGKIEELVIDVATGKINYAALSVGGLLGVGDKLFAVPWNQFTLKHGQDETTFILDMSKEKLEAAPGFNKDKWPNVADANWKQEVDRYYQKAERANIDRTTPPRR